MPQNIYCDEAGFSGNNLRDADQPYFTYSAVAVSNEEAAAIVAKTIRDYGIYGDELKGKSLVRHSRGQKAITAIIEQYSSCALVAAFHKHYCLATKFFEYVFEPVVAEQNSLFYAIGFHRFIANVLYFESLQTDPRAETALLAFQAAIRSRDGAAVARLFPTKIVQPGYSRVLTDIEDFVAANQEAIAEDMASYSGDDPMHRWTLDLSVTALFSLLTTWGQRFDSLVVFCDESKPLKASREPFDMMIGRTDKAEVVFEGKRQHLVFNLAEPLRFVTSHSTPGIQLADVFSTALSFALKSPRDELSSKWLGLLHDAVSEFSVFPEHERISLDSEQGFVNRAVLRELVERSQRKVSVFENMPQFILSAREYWVRNRILGPL